MTALAITRREEIISRLRSGAFLRDIAQELGITPSAVSHALSKDPEYKQAREQGAEEQLDDWQVQIRDAADAFNLARAREGFKAASWRAEREFPHRWGQRSHVTIENVGDLADKLRRSRERVIDAMPQDVQVIESNGTAAQQLENRSA